MLSYHGAFDLNHSIYRMLRLVERHPEKSMAWNTFRILDYYYLFPHELKHLEWPRSILRFKSKFAYTETKYNRIGNQRHLAYQLELIEDLSARSLASKGFIDAGALQQGALSRTDKAVPADLEAVIQQSDGAEDALVTFLAQNLSQVPLLGEKGLKARSGLLEHRYDAA
jgi:hypothetical protein